MPTTDVYEHINVVSARNAWGTIIHCCMLLLYLLANFAHQQLDPPGVCDPILDGQRLCILHHNINLQKGNEHLIHSTLLSILDLKDYIVNSVFSDTMDYTYCVEEINTLIHITLISLLIHPYFTLLVVTTDIVNQFLIDFPIPENMYLI